MVASGGYRIHVPDYTRALIRRIVENAEVWWCTTWRHRANDEIATFLGIGPLPFVDDGSAIRSVDWKAAAARPLIDRALAERREVYWIEDFYGEPLVGEVPSAVRFIDTAPDGGADAVLTPEMIPSVLLEGTSMSQEVV